MIWNGQEFYDIATGRHMMIKIHGGDPWLFYKHPDGQWVTQRKATPDDISRIEAAYGQTQFISREAAESILRPHLSDAEFGKAVYEMLAQHAREGESGLDTVKRLIHNHVAPGVSVTASLDGVLEIVRADGGHIKDFKGVYTMDEARDAFLSMLDDWQSGR